jgi:Domain of unknown function (DUF4271)
MIEDKKIAKPALIDSTNQSAQVVLFKAHLKHFLRQSLSAHTFRNLTSQIRYCIFFLACVIQYAAVTTCKAQVGPGEGYFLVQDLQNDWLVYEQSVKDYVPFIAEAHADQKACNLLIDLESNRKYYLLLKVPAGSHLFLNASLHTRAADAQWQVFSIDSLHKLYKKPNLLLTVYGTAGIADKSVLIGHKKNTTEKIIDITGDDILKIFPRQSGLLNNFFTILLLLIVGFAATLYSSNIRAFFRYYSFVDLFSLDLRQDTFLINKPLSRINFAFLLLLSTLLLFLYFFVIDKNNSLFGFTQNVSNSQTFLVNLWVILRTLVVILSLLLAKYLLLFMLGQLYHIESSVINVHYFKDIQSSVMFFSGIFVLLATTSIYIHDWDGLITPMLLIPSIVFYALRLVLLYFTIISGNNTKSLQLISYLCIAELIPLIIGVRYAL